MDHKERFKELLELDETATGDTERKALFWLLSANEDLFKKVHHIYNFEEHWIIPDIFESSEVDFASSSRSMIKLGFNLYNSYNEKGTDVLSIFCNLDEHNYEIAIEAIKIRLGKIKF